MHQDKALVATSTSRTPLIIHEWRYINIAEEGKKDSKRRRDITAELRARMQAINARRAEEKKESADRRRRRQRHAVLSRKRRKLCCIVNIHAYVTYLK